MPSGPGFWLDPSSGKLHRVTTHNDWLLVPENQEIIGLGSNEKQVLASFDPIKQIDEIRMVGVMHGLVRIRQYRNHVTVQFYAENTKIAEILEVAVGAIPDALGVKNPYLTIQNLFDDVVLHMELLRLQENLDGLAGKLPATKPIIYNEILRQKMNTLLSNNRNREISSSQISTGKRGTFYEGTRGTLFVNPIQLATHRSIFKFVHINRMVSRLRCSE